MPCAEKLIFYEDCKINTFLYFQIFSNTIKMTKTFLVLAVAIMAVCIVSIDAGKSFELYHINELLQPSLTQLKILLEFQKI